MTPDAEVMRQFVSDLYPGRWKRHVAKMRDDQVMAIYFRERKKAEEAEAEKKEKPDDEIPF